MYGEQPGRLKKPDLNTKNITNNVETTAILKIIYINIRSVRNKTDELEIILKQYSPDIVILTETWLYEDEAAQIHFEQYSTITACRQTRGGGVAIILRQNIRYEYVKEDNTMNNNMLLLNLIDLKFNLGAVYKQPSSCSKNFIESFEQFFANNKRYLIIGDMNINLLANDANTKDYMDMLHGTGLLVLNNLTLSDATRIDEHRGTKTIIDHVLTNFIEESTLLWQDHYISDHKMLLLDVKTQNIPQKIEKQIYTTKTTDYQKLKDSLSNKLEQLPDENLNFEYLTNLVKSETESFTKNIVRKYTTNIEEGWFTLSISNEIKERDWFYRKMKQYPEKEEYERKFKDLRQEIKNAIKYNQKKHMESLLKNCDNSSKKQWDLIKKIVNKNKNKNCCEKIIIDNTTITEPEEIAELFNTHFINVASKIVTQANTHNECTLNYVSNSTMYLRKTSSLEITNIITSLKNNAAPGYDGIKAKTIKQLVLVLAPIISKIINNCLIQGEFPDILKIAKVTPVYKKGSKYDINNYRPISVLPVFSKIYEKVIKNRLLQHLNENGILSPCQNGFLNGKSTESALTTIMEYVYDSIDKKQSILMVFLDLCKAFDVVDHSILLRKLKLLGVTNKTYDLFSSYLGNRGQFTEVNGEISSLGQVRYGVPQGSILGPILFLTYINDMVNINLGGIITLFADDTALIYSGSQIDIFSRAQRDLSVITEWCHSNNIKLNENKCNYLVIRKANDCVNIGLTLNNKPINEVQSAKYLGITIDNQLNFSEHIKTIKQKINSICFYLRRNAFMMNNNTRYQIYYAYICSHISYLSAFWGLTTKNHIHELQIAQNRLLKILFNKPFRTNTQELYINLKLLTIDEIIKLNSVKLIYKIANNILLTNINFLHNYNVHQHNTRSNQQLHILPATTNIVQRKITCKAASWFNELPMSVRETRTLPAFTKEVKKVILANRL